MFCGEDFAFFLIHIRIAVGIESPEKRPAMKMRIYVLKEPFTRAEVDGKNLASATYIRLHFPKCSMYVGYLPTLGETWRHSKGNVGK